MFKDEYRRRQEAVHADESLIRRTLNAAARSKAQPRASWKPLLIAALCVLLVAVPVFLRRPTPQQATSSSATATPVPAFSPVGHSTQVDGMTLRYLSSYASEGSTWILLSLQGEAVTEEMTLEFALTSEKTGQTFWVGTSTSNHDPDRQLSTFILEFHDSDLTQYTSLELTADSWRFSDAASDPISRKSLPANDHLTLTLLSYRHLHGAPLGDPLPLDTLPTHAATTLCEVDSAYPEIAAPNGKATVLAPNAGRKCAPFADVTVSASFIGDSLYVQTEAPGGTMLADGQTITSCWVYLMPMRITENPWLLRGIVEGLPAPAVTTVRNGPTQLRDYRFDVNREELLNDYEAWQLWAVALQSIDMSDNASRLTFTLGE